MPGVPSKLSRELSNVRVQLKSGKTRGVYSRALEEDEVEALRVREQKLTAGITKAIQGGRVRATASREPSVAAAETKSNQPVEAGSEPGTLAAAKARAETKLEAKDRRGARCATAPRRPARASRSQSLPLPWRKPALQPGDVVAPVDGKAHSANYGRLTLRGADGGVMSKERGASCAAGTPRTVAPVGGNTRHENFKEATMCAADGRVEGAEHGASCARRAPRWPSRVTGKRCIMKSATADEDETRRDSRNEDDAIETCGASYVKRSRPFTDAESVKNRRGGRGEDGRLWMDEQTRGAIYGETKTKEELTAKAAESKIG